MFFFKQKTAYEMRISYWSSDVCSSDLHLGGDRLQPHGRRPQGDAGMTAAPVLQIEGLTVCYRSGRRLLPAVQQFDLTLDAGEAYGLDRKSTRLNSSHYCASRMPSSA